VTLPLPSLAGYPAVDGDEVVAPGGRLRERAEPLRPLLARTDLPALGEAAGRAFRARGAELGTWRDGRLTVRPVALDPVPRVLPASEWRPVAAGVAQRHRALAAFLADVYRAAGRRRGDRDRAPDVVRAGVLPEWAVARNPAREPSAVGYAWRGQPRIAVLGCDLVRTGGGRWLVRQDAARDPAGLGPALAARAAVAGAAPALLPEVPVAQPEDAVGLLRTALAAAAPPGVAGPPRVAVLTGGTEDAAAAEHALVAGALGLPLVGPGDLWPRVDGGLAAVVDGVRQPIDVLHRRMDDAELAVHRTPSGQPLAALLGEAVRSGRLGLADVPGNGLADDLSTFPAVPDLVRFYLREEPLLDQVPTWLLADEAQWAQVRDRLHELLVVPVAGYGGGGAVAGPDCSPARLAELQAEVAAAPHRFVARELVPASTAPALVDGALAPRTVDLRVFSVATGPATVEVLPAPLSRVALAAGSQDTDLAGDAAVKDTWLPLS
jgi:uncharacterized circularly permuted ATP-grasp superfamily protein